MGETLSAEKLAEITGQVPKRYDETYPAGMNGNRTYVEDNFCDTYR
jgi:hypothetical protein